MGINELIANAATLAGIKMDKLNYKLDKRRAEQQEAQNNAQFWINMGGLASNVGSTIVGAVNSGQQRIADDDWRKRTEIQWAKENQAEADRLSLEQQREANDIKDKYDSGVSAGLANLEAQGYSISTEDIAKASAKYPGNSRNAITALTQEVKKTQDLTTVLPNGETVIVTPAEYNALKVSDSAQARLVMNKMYEDYGMLLSQTEGLTPFSSLEEAKNNVKPGQFFLLQNKIDDKYKQTQDGLSQRFASSGYIDTEGRAYTGGMAVEAWKRDNEAWLSEKAYEASATAQAKIQQSQKALDYNAESQKNIADVTKYIYEAQSEIATNYYNGLYNQALSSMGIAPDSSEKSSIVLPSYVLQKIEDTANVYAYNYSMQDSYLDSLLGSTGITTEQKNIIKASIQQTFKSELDSINNRTQGKIGQDAWESTSNKKRSEESFNSIREKAKSLTGAR